MRAHKVERIKKNCLHCGHNRFFNKNGSVVSGKYCTKCNSPPMKIVQITNKHKNMVNKKVLLNE